MDPLPNKQKLSNRAEFNSEAFEFFFDKKLVPPVVRVVTGLSYHEQLRVVVTSTSGDMDFVENTESARYLRRVFALPGDGLFVARYPDAKKRNMSVLAVVKDGCITIIEDPDQVLQVVSDAFPGSLDAVNAKIKKMQQTETAAADVWSQARSRRYEMVIQSREKSGVDVTPVFAPLPEVSCISRMLSQGASASQLLDEICLPLEFSIQKPHAVTGKTLDQAIASLRVAQKAAQAVAANGKSLPFLSGTPKQIAFAASIRSSFALKNPEHPLLQQATSAVYWIENRIKLPS